MTTDSCTPAASPSSALVEAIKRFLALFQEVAPEEVGKPKCDLVFAKCHITVLFQSFRSGIVLFVFCATVSQKTIVPDHHSSTEIFWYFYMPVLRDLAFLIMEKAHRCVQRKGRIQQNKVCFKRMISTVWLEILHHTP